MKKLLFLIPLLLIGCNYPTEDVTDCKIVGKYESWQSYSIYVVGKRKDGAMKQESIEIESEDYYKSLKTGDSIKLGVCK